MPVGHNVRVTVWELDYDTDDEVGGAMPTGTPLARNVYGRFGQRSTSQLLLQQGLESEPIFFLEVQPFDLDIRQRYEIEITYPGTHLYYKKRFRILGIPVRPAFPINDRRAFMLLDLSRSEEAHTEQ